MRLIDKERSIIKKEFFKFLESEGVKNAFLEDFNNPKVAKFDSSQDFLDNERPGIWIANMDWHGVIKYGSGVEWTHIDVKWMKQLKKEFKKSLITKL